MHAPLVSLASTLALALAAGSAISPGPGGQGGEEGDERSAQHGITSGEGSSPAPS